jgi:hypothetical protein
MMRLPKPAVLLCVASLALPACRGASMPKESWTTEARLPGVTFNDLVSDGRGNVFAGGTKLYWREAKSAPGAPWSEIPLPMASTIHALDAGADGQLWAAAGAGNVFFRGAGGSVEHEHIPGARGDLQNIRAWPDEVWTIEVEPVIHRRKDGKWETWTPAELANLWTGALGGTSGKDVFLGLRPRQTGAQEFSIAHFDGTTWQVEKFAQNGWITDIDASSPTNVWAVGIAPKIVGKGAIVLRYDGKSWARVPFPVDARLTYLRVRSPTEAWATSYDGLLFRWDGKIWKGVQLNTKERLLSPTVTPDDVVRVLAGPDTVLARP